MKIDFKLIVPALAIVVVIYVGFRLKFIAQEINDLKMENGALVSQINYYTQNLEFQEANLGNSLSSMVSDANYHNDSLKIAIIAGKSNNIENLTQLLKYVNTELGITKNEVLFLSDVESLINLQKLDSEVKVLKNTERYKSILYSNNIAFVILNNRQKIVFSFLYEPSEDALLLRHFKISKRFLNE